MANSLLGARIRAGVVAGCAAVVVALSGCGGQEVVGEDVGGEDVAEPEVVAVDDAPTSECLPLNVVTGFYPLQFVAERVGSDQTTVSVLAGPGVEAHDLELTPSQAAEVTDADLVSYLPEFIPSLDEAINELNPDAAFDASAGLDLIAGESHDHGDSHSHEGEEALDPHVWLDPTNVSAIANGLSVRLGELDPVCSTTYADNAKALTEEMSTLDAEMSRGLANCKIKTMVVSHQAFGYLANRYGLEQVGISGLTPEAEPSPSRLAEVAKISKSDGVTTIYYETLVSPVVAETLAAELGISAVMLDPLESKPASGDFVSQMRVNLAALTKGQDCG